MTEDDLRAEVQKEIRSLQGHISWVESHMTSAGFPDSDICVNGTILQMELKVVKDHGKVKIRPTQFRWFKDRIKAGGSPVLLIGDDDGYYVAPGFAIYDPEPLTNIRQLKSRTHYKASDITLAIKIALSIAIEKRG